MNANPFLTAAELTKVLSEASQVFVLVDDNTRRCCLPLFERLCGVSYVLLEIPAGESHKNLHEAEVLWKALLTHHADRNSVMVNLGGGVVGDLGGFVASCYQRGIGYINVPTTLLAMIDAAIGGKTAIDFEGLKNQIGSFYFPKGVFLCPDFLKTLPQRERLSGLAEMIKYGYIAHPDLLDADTGNYVLHIQEAAMVKWRVVNEDPYEQGRRKILNFGHTLGHAIESWMLNTDKPLSHGEAVALGMYAALWLSVRLCGLAPEVLDAYWDIFRRNFASAKRSFTETDLDAIAALTLCDKKNRNGAVQFVLLKALGQPIIDVAVDMETVKLALFELQKLMKI